MPIGEVLDWPTEMLQISDDVLDLTQAETGEEFSELINDVMNGVRGVSIDLLHP